MMTKRIGAALADPAVHGWAKRALRDLMQDDPVDAYYDAKLVADLLKQRLDLILARQVGDTLTIRALEGAARET